MTHPLRATLVPILASLAAFATPATAQWVEQSFTLEAGWNSVFLEVDPWPAEADALFDGLPIETVWTPKDDPVVDIPPLVGFEPPVEGPWWVWLPPDHPAAYASNLGIIRGGRVYLIKATEPTTWLVTGQPTGSVTRWRDGLTLSGLHVDASQPRFAEYFEGSTAHDDSEIYAINSDASFTPLTETQGVCSGGDDDGDPCFDDSVCGGEGSCVGAAVQTIQTGVGYWVSADEVISYDGPIAISRKNLRGIEYGSGLLEDTLDMRNLSDSTKQVSLSLSASAAVPATPAGQAGLEGELPLRWLDYGAGSQIDDVYQWRGIAYDVGGPSWTLAGAGQATSRQSLRLEADRRGLAGAMVEDVCIGGPTSGAPCGASGDCGEGGTCGESGSLYQGILTVSDGDGFRRWLPVTGEVRISPDLNRGGTPQPLAGLWVGSVTLNEVSWVTSPLSFDADARCVGGDIDGDVCDTTEECTGGGACTTLGPDSPRPVRESVDLRVIIHLSDAGEYNLLSEVTLRFDPPPENSNASGSYVLVTPDCDPAVCGNFVASSVVDGEPFSRRVSSAAFQFDGPQPMTGDFATSSRSLNTTINMAADGRLNPFRHRQHPDHIDGYAISRAITLTFPANPPPGVVAAGWGYSILGGTYEETITGLHRDPINTRGFFQLRRVSQVGTLNE